VQQVRRVLRAPPVRQEPLERQVPWVGRVQVPPELLALQVLARAGLLG
jgi:hypothetical protein